MKRLEKYGIAALDFTDPDVAADYTYTTSDGRLVPTPLVFPDNPFNETVLNADRILDLGCGVGRNLPWILEHTNADYYGLDPNESMIQSFWKIQDKKLYGSWVTLVNDFDEMQELENPKFDVVVCTFVFQHIGFRPSENQMNVSDITKAALKFCHKDTIWIMYEHDFEEQWIDRWLEECEIVPSVYHRNYTGIPELTHRGPHHLIIWKVG